MIRIHCALFLISLFITACAAPLSTTSAPAQQISEVSETSEISTSTLPAPTETPTLEPTATPTPEPTATPTPEPREFVPANDIEFVEEHPDYKLRLAPDADRDAIYWDIIVSHLGDVISKSKGMEANRAVYEEIIKDHPEWEGIGNGWDYKERVEFMKEFLKRTGGWMIITDINFKKYNANFNEEIIFEVKKVREFPEGYATSIREKDSDSIGKGAGLGIYTKENGQLVYSVAVVNDAINYTLNENELSMYNIADWTVGELVSDLFRKLIAITAMHSRVDLDEVSATNDKLYVKSDGLDSQRYFRSVTWTFIK